MCWLTEHDKINEKQKDEGKKRKKEKQEGGGREGGWLPRRTLAIGSRHLIF